MSPNEKRSQEYVQRTEMKIADRDDCFVKVNSGTQERRMEGDDDDDDDGIEDFTLTEQGCFPNSSPADAVLPFFENVTIFGELFRAAFSDGYHCSSCCSEKEVVRGPLWTDSNCRTMTPPPPPTSSTTSTTKTRSVVMSATSEEGKVIRSQDSHSTSSGSRKQRKKGLAVAAGYKYAEDMYGRPVVIVPGHHQQHRRSPILRAATSRDSGETFHSYNNFSATHHHHHQHLHGENKEKDEFP